MSPVDFLVGWLVVSAVGGVVLAGLSVVPSGRAICNGCGVRSPFAFRRETALRRAVDAGWVLPADAGCLRRNIGCYCSRCWHPFMNTQARFGVDHTHGSGNQ